MSKKDDSMISIVVPVFNNGTAIARCLDSLLAQTHTDLEIILVYLESSDNTWDVIQSFADPRIHIFHQKERTGPGGARNIGLNHATGNYIGFCDADDWVEPDFFAKLYAALIKYGADISMGEMRSSADKPFLYTHEKVYATFESKLSLQQNGAVFTKLFRSGIIQERAIRFTEGVYWEDNPWLLKALYVSQNLVVVPGAYYHYLPTPKSVSHAQRLEDDVVPVARQMLAFVNEQQLSLQEQEAVEAFILRSFAQGFVQKRKKIYYEFMEILGNQALLKTLRKRYILKHIFRFSLRKRYIVLFGRKFSQKDKK